jgi:hypothetical protein
MWNNSDERWPDRCKGQRPRAEDELLHKLYTRVHGATFNTNMR